MFWHSNVIGSGGTRGRGLLAGGALGRIGFLQLRFHRLERIGGSGLLFGVVGQLESIHQERAKWDGNVERIERRGIGRSFGCDIEARAARPSWQSLRLRNRPEGNKGIAKSHHDQAAHGVVLDHEPASRLGLEPRVPGGWVGGLDTGNVENRWRGHGRHFLRQVRWIVAGLLVDVIHHDHRGGDVLLLQLEAEFIDGVEDGHVGSVTALTI